MPAKTLLYGAITQILPGIHRKNCIAWIGAFFGCISGVSSIFGGTIAELLSNSAAFQVSAALHFFVIVIFLRLVYDTQSKLTKMQLEFRSVYEENPNLFSSGEKFPITGNSKIVSSDHVQHIEGSSKLVNLYISISMSAICISIGCFTRDIYPKYIDEVMQMEMQSKHRQCWLCAVCSE